MSIARSYAAIARYFAYASPQNTPNTPPIFVDSDGHKVSPGFRHIQVSCISHVSLQTLTIPCQKIDPSQTDLYELCLHKNLLDSRVSYLFMAVPLQSIGAIQQYKVFASPLSPQGKPANTATKIYENLNARIFIPLILLPLANDKKASGVFLLDDWLCLYDNGDLIYECVCNDIASLRDALAFIDSMYSTAKQLHYYQALSFSITPSILESSLQESSPTLTISPIPTPIHQLLDTYLQSDTFPQLQNPHAKHFLHTHSFWYGLGLVACCALIIALPLCKLFYANHVDSRAAQLAVRNAELSQTIQAKTLNIAKLPQLDTQITDTIHNLHTIKSHYISRLEILATLSQIARSSNAWITYLHIQGNLHRGEALLELSCQAQNQANIHALMQSLHNTPRLEIVSSQEDENPSDVFETKLTLKISNA